MRLVLPCVAACVAVVLATSPTLLLSLASFGGWAITASLCIFGLVHLQATASTILANHASWTALMAAADASEAAAFAAANKPPPAPAATPSPLAATLDDSLPRILVRDWQVDAEVAEELASTLQAVVRDFVASWYTASVSTDPQFLQYVERAMTHAVGSILHRSRKLMVLLFLCEDATEALRYHLYWFNEMVTRARRAHPGAFRASDTTHDQVLQQHRLIMREYQRDNVLHRACSRSLPLVGEPPGEGGDHAVAETAYLRGVVEQLLPALLPEQETHSVVSMALLREVATQSLMLPLVRAITPDALNQWLIAGSELSREVVANPDTATLPTPPPRTDHAPNDGREAKAGGGEAEGGVVVEPPSLPPPPPSPALAPASRLPIVPASTAFAPTPGGDAGRVFVVGEMSRGRAESLLSACPPGAFLIRFRSSGVAVLSCVSGDGFTAGGSLVYRAPPTSATSISSAGSSDVASAEVFHARMPLVDGRWSLWDRGTFPSLADVLCAAKDCCRYGVRDAGGDSPYLQALWVEEEEPGGDGDTLSQLLNGLSLSGGTDQGAGSVAAAELFKSDQEFRLWRKKPAAGAGAASGESGGTTTVPPSLPSSTKLPPMYGSPVKGAVITVAPWLPECHRANAEGLAKRLANRRSFRSLRMSRVICTPRPPIKAHVVNGAVYTMDGVEAVRYEIQRFSEFHTLYTILRTQCPSFRAKLPPKTLLNMGTTGEKFIRSRCVALEAWLQAVLTHPFLFDCHEVRMFLRKGRNASHVVTSAGSAPVMIYATTTRGGGDPTSPRSDDGDGDDDGESSSAATAAAANPFAGASSTAGATEELQFNATVWAKVVAHRASQVRVGLTREQLRVSEQHVYALLSELFGLHTRHWLQRRMVGVSKALLVFLFHGTVARAIRREYFRLTSPSYVAGLVRWGRHTFWPGGVWNPASPPRELHDVLHARSQSLEQLLATVHVPLNALVSAPSSMKKLHSMLQLPVVVRSLTLTLFDLLLARLFPGIDVAGLQHRPPVTYTKPDV